MSRATADLQILACDASSVEIKGTRAGDVSTGMLFINIDADYTCSTPCSPLLRRVTGTITTPSGSRILSTTDATFAEILGPTLVKDAFKNISAESVSGCFYPTGVSAVGSCSRNWLEKNEDGRCTHTNCFVGTSGNPNDCFECKLGCDKGCGSKNSILTTDGYPLLSSFGAACCNHDHCWSSNSRSKAYCDEHLYQSMRAECPTLPSVVSLGLNFTGPLKAALGQCDIAAFLFVSAIALDPFDAYESAMRKQRQYESTGTCIATCPTSQQHSGQGSTVLTIDMLRTSGTFPVTYQMYGDPDQLVIDYEGTRIFDTGSPGPGSGTANVRFAGRSSLIKVIIARNTDSAWDVDVGCPIPLV
jgi:hypothetical protein